MTFRDKPRFYMDHYDECDNIRYTLIVRRVVGTCHFALWVSYYYVWASIKLEYATSIDYFRKMIILK